MRVALRALLLAAVACAAPMPVIAEGDDSAVPYEGFAFDDANHRLWYARFWTGKCTGLSLFVCRSGQPYWNATMRQLSASVQADRREAFSRRLFALGRLIGHEWAKENDIRKISTDDIRAWYREMEKGGDPEPVIARIEADAKRRLSRN